MIPKSEVFDVTIIGGGPVGLFTAMYCGMRDLKTKIIECYPDFGGKVTKAFPDKLIRDLGGIVSISGVELITQLEIQAHTFDPTFVMGQRVVGLDRKSDGTFILTSENGEKHDTRTVILAVGYGTFVPRKLDNEDFLPYEGNNLHYAVDQIEHFRGKRVLILGGGNSAVDWANALEPITSQLMVVHRRTEFSGHEQDVCKMIESSARILTPYEMIRPIGQNVHIQRVLLRHAETGRHQEVEVDEVIVSIGIMGDLGPIREWGLELEGDRIVVDQKMATNIPGVFAAGDAVTYANKLHLIAAGFTEGPTAVNSAKSYLDPKAHPSARVSTHHEQMIERAEKKGSIV